MNPYNLSMECSTVKHRHPPTICIPLPPKKQRSVKPETLAETALAVAKKEIDQHKERIVQLHTRRCIEAGGGSTP